jgi:hypothetical protein
MHNAQYTIQMMPTLISFPNKPHIGRHQILDNGFAPKVGALTPCSVLCASFSREDDDVSVLSDPSLLDDNKAEPPRPVVNRVVGDGSASNYDTSAHTALHISQGSLVSKDRGIWSEVPVGGGSLEDEENEEEDADDMDPYYDSSWSGRTYFSCCQQSWGDQSALGSSSESKGWNQEPAAWEETGLHVIYLEDAALD